MANQVSEQKEMTWDWLIYHNELCGTNGEPFTVWFITGKENDRDEFGTFDSPLEAVEYLYELLKKREGACGVQNMDTY